jgi:hypothetical protein
VLAALVMTGVVAAVCSSGRVRAQERDPREAEAKKACLGGGADHGIELLAELYAETNDPTYIYNQGRCFEQNGRSTDALTRFREYLRKAPSLGAEEKAQVQAHIADMEAQEKQEKQDAPPVAPAPVVTVVAPAAVSDTAHELRVAGIATASVGVALVATGIYFGARTQSLSNEVTSDAKKGQFSQSKYDEGQRDQLLQWVGYGIGAAALVSGGLLYYFSSHRGGDEAPTVAAAPTLGPGMGGASVRVTF